MRVAGVTTLLALAAVGLSVPGQAQQPPPGGASSGGKGLAFENGEALQEVIVTAQKKVERLQDVPVPVTAVNAESLLDANETNLEDYYSQIPGLAYTSNLRGAPIIAIRGLVTGTDLINPTVAVVVDDVPFGSSTSLGGGDSTPDLDPSDLARIEVLRGPQGTLYGASSLGGLIKFVTVDPSTESFSGRVQAGTSGISNGAEFGYNARGSVNVPLTDQVALLGSAFTHEDPGYIDNPVLGIRGVNESRSSGGRLAVLWKPSEDFSLRLSALLQETKTDGASHVEEGTGLGDLQQNDIRGTGILDRNFQVYSAIATAKLGSTELTAVTGYGISRVTDWIDYTAGLGFLDGLTAPSLGIPNGTTGPVLMDYNHNSKFTQEFRLTAPLGPRVDWLVGAFYMHERTPDVQTILAADPSSGETLGNWGNFSWWTTYDEISGFTDLTFKLTDRFDLQLGAREAHIRQSYQETDTGPIVPIAEGVPSPNVLSEVVTHDDAFTYLLTPRFKVSPDFMLYARLSSGYRPGGPNPTAAPFGLPLSYKPDKAQNYEVGLKGDIGHTLSVDASVYYIDWKDIQLTFIDPNNGFGFNANGSRAKSQGVELSAESKPLSGLTVSAWVAFSDAVLTEPFPANSSLYGASGDRLPFGARFSGNLTIEERVPLSAHVTGFAGGSISYVGDRVGNFTSPPPAVPPRQDYPAYARTDLHLGAAYANWTGTLFVTNLTDKRGLVYGGLGSIPNPADFVVIQPRTIGLELTTTF